MAYAVKTFDTNEVPLVLEFDFVPAEPTTAQLEKLVPNTCDNCEWKNFRNTGYCKSVDLPAGMHCAEWKIGPDAYAMARIAYYKTLHKERYG